MQAAIRGAIESIINAQAELSKALTYINQLVESTDGKVQAEYIRIEYLLSKKSQALNDLVRHLIQTDDNNRP